MLVIKAGTLLGGTGAMSTNRAVVIKGDTIDKITDIGEVEFPRGATIIDASDRTVMPGMIDAHVHVAMASGDPDEYEWLVRRNGNVSLSTLAYRAAANARRHLEAGVTAIRDTGGRAYVELALRDAIEAGDATGPRMIVAGHALSSTGRSFDPVRGLTPEVDIPRWSYKVDSADEGRKAARYQVQMGVDYIEVSAVTGQDMPSLDTWRALCEVAHSAGDQAAGRGLGLRVGADVHGGPGVADAIKAGVYCLEHGNFLSDELLEMMVENGVYYEPTLSCNARPLELGQEETGFDDAQWSYKQQLYDGMCDTLERAYRMGVKISAGSDAYMPFVQHGELAYELDQYVKIAMTPMEAIVAATKTGAEVLGMDQDIGTLEAGKLADVLVVAGDPVADISILQDKRRIEKVIKGGEIVVDRHRRNARPSGTEPR